MRSIFKTYKSFFIIAFCFFVSISAYSQRDEDTWRLLASLGVNNPIDDVKNDGYYAKNINFPSVNLGVQYMFNRDMGARLDYGFNRSKSEDGSRDFKLNYSRVNAQFVYKLSNKLHFLPPDLGVSLHAGPGMSFTKPLGYDTNNTYSFLNLLGGMEVNYKISRTFAVLLDGSFVLSMAGESKYDPAVDGFSFKGNLGYIAVGISVSLKDCNTCD